MAKIELKYITKNAPLQTEIKETKNFLSMQPKKHFWELCGISFSVNYGEAVGIVGINGSGKSSLLRIIAGLERQTTGFITTKSKINYANITYNLDFEATGLENIRQKINEANIDNFKGDHLTNAIINFTEIGQWLYRPVKSYSLGMKARLALGMALLIEPDLVLVDDILYLLDRMFYQKVAKKIQMLKDTGVSFLITDTRGLMLESFCERTLWLEFGVQEDFGATRDVLPQFDYYLDWYNGLDLPEKNKYLAKKQAEQSDFDVSKIYEQFKVEQFQHGYTRKDEARMRKAFYVERGVDPVSGDEDSELAKQKASKELKKATKFSKKGLFAVIACLIVVGIGGWWLLSGKPLALTKKQAKESSRIASIQKAEQSSLAQKSVAKKVSSSKAKKIQEQQTATPQVTQSSVASESSQSSQSSQSSTEQSSSSSIQEQTQDITVQDGDTMGELASKYNTTVAKIQELNNLGQSTDLTAGTTIKVPK